MYFVHVYIYIYIFKIYKKKIKKKFQDFQIFPKKEKIFQETKKGLWTRGIVPLSHLKKKKKKNSLN